MKKKLLCLLLLVAGAMNAQIVNIPDANFKNSLLNHVPAIDTNNDGQIQVSEAQAATALAIADTSANAIQNLQGLEAFINVTAIDLNCNQITSINLSVLSQLSSATINGNHIETINLSGLSTINYLDITAFSLENLDITDLQSLESLKLYYVSLPTVIHDTLPVLEQIEIHGSIITTLSLINCPDLQQLDFIFSGFTSIDVSGCTNLQSINIDNSTEDSQSVLNLGGNTSLTSFSFVGKISTLDLSECPALQYLYINLLTAGDDAYINLKNGNAAYESVFTPSISIGNGYSGYICIDEGEAESLPYWPENLFFSSYCSFTPGGNYNTITGSVTFDADNDGCGTNDIAIPFSAVQISDGTVTGYSYSTNNTYNHYTQAGTFTLIPQFENDYFTASPAIVTFADNNNNTATQNFCITANGIHPDVEVIAYGSNAQPGYNNYYTVIYKNKGNQTLSGTLTFTYDDTILDYIEAEPVETMAAAGNLTWNYTNLLPFESRYITVGLNLNGPMETPAVNIDDILQFAVSITPAAGDETPEDNSFVYNQTVVGSFDPNDITCLEGATVHPDKIGEYLHYNINFENTGTAPATFVVVKDIIDETKFDVNSLVVLNASHNVATRLTGNKAEFYFDNINLAANGGKGNVTFKIKSLETLAINSSVMQKADIFFDYNWPIVTNEAVTTYGILNTPDFTKDTSVKVYPNPAKNVVSITAGSAIQSIELLDVQGRLLEAKSVNNISAMLDITQRPNGIYFIKVATNKGMKIEKLVKE